MFISSMARKNIEKQRELQQSCSSKTNRPKSRRDELSVNGEKPFMSQKGFSIQSSKPRHGRSVSAPILSEVAPKSHVEAIHNKNSSSHQEEIQLDPERFHLAIDLDDFKGYTYKEDSNEQSDWFLNPVHRHNESSIPFSELVQRKPLTASVMKATANGTLSRDYEEDISQTPLNEFDMDVFKESDMRTYRQEIRRSLGLRSPFELELAKLRQEKLKLEEAYLLKLKCEAELEETRGPKPKWYELKTKNFSREARKHNNLLSHSNDWKDLIGYRNELIEASGRWENLRQ